MTFGSHQQKSIFTLGTALGLHVLCFPEHQHSSRQMQYITPVGAEQFLCWFILVFIGHSAIPLHNRAR